MTTLRLFFAGEIKKAESKNIGGKSLVELSVCKKHKGRNDAEDTFTWVNVAVWEPAEFQIGKLTQGSFVAGSGEFQLRSYLKKDNTKGTSADVRCSSFDIEVSDGSVRGQAEAIPQRAAGPIKPTIGGGASFMGIDGEPPFRHLVDLG